MLFIDYTNAVLQDYENKRKNDKLSSRLSHPSPAELRDECEAVFKDRYTSKDAPALRTFFGSFDTKESAWQLIRNHPIDKFRPLVNFLKRDIKEPKKKNIELLAWLIDFEHRPYDYNKNYIKTEEDKEIEGIPEEEAAAEMITENLKPVEDPAPIPVAAAPVAKNKARFRIKKIPFVFAVLLLAASGVLLYKEKDRNEQVMGTAFNRFQSCMYWTGYRYDQISCNEKMGDTLVIALDTAKMLHFKKITTPDTISMNDIGKVYYIKLNGAIEYYTARGVHPVYTDRRLKPLTVFMYEKYILPLKK